MSFSLSDLFERKQRAETLLDDPMLVECWAAARVKILLEFEHSSSPEARERAHQQLLALKTIRARLVSIAQDYELARRNQK